MIKMIKMIKFLSGSGLPVALCLIVAALGGSSIYYKRVVNIQKAEIAVLVNNNNAYSKELSGLITQGGVYQFTIDQLNHSNDSMVMEINQVRRQLGIRDQMIKDLTVFGSRISVRDTIVVYRDSRDFVDFSDLGDIRDYSDCDFEVRHEFNEFTVLHAKLENGVFMPEIDIRDKFYLYQYQEMV